MLHPWFFDSYFLWSRLGIIIEYVIYIITEHFIYAFLSHSLDVPQLFLYQEPAFKTGSFISLQTPCSYYHNPLF